MQAFDLDPNLYAPAAGLFRLWPGLSPGGKHAQRSVMREWRGRVPAEKTEAYLDYMRRTGLKDYAATPGHLGSWVLAERRDGATEFLLLTQWASRELIRAFAGEDIGRARYYQDDAEYLLELPPRLRHYEVLARP